MLTLSDRNCRESVIGIHGLDSKELLRCSNSIQSAQVGLDRQIKAGQLGFYDLPSKKQEALKIQAFARRWRGKYENFVVIGIGGSALGNIAIQNALRHPNWNLLSTKRRSGWLKLFVPDNVDPGLIKGMLDVIDVRKTLFNVISKSGTTAECLANYFIVRKALEKKVGVSQMRRQLLFTTDPERGYLRETSNREGIQTFDVPQNVGGRFSVLSAVGLVSAAATGIDIVKILDGAKSMRRRCEMAKGVANPAGLYAALHHLYYRKGRKIHVMIPYSNQLKDMADWFRQLWAESLGKRVDRNGRIQFVGPTPVKALGVTDQHSQFQLYIEGPQDKLLTFLSVRKFEEDLVIPKVNGHYLGNQFLSKLLKTEERATIAALSKEGRPSMTITLPDVNPFSIGELVFMLEAATAYAGEFFNVNAYDQPGVEQGKLLTYALMGRNGYRHHIKRFRKWLGRGTL